MYAHFFKPLLDFVAAALLLLIFTPIIAACTVFIALIMGRPIFFRQRRPGLEGEIFSIFKFRTMTQERGADGELLPDSERLKGFGKLLRKTSLDELPQLFNVLKGEMSFVGPRPLLVEYLPLYSERQKLRHTVKPGITGLAQINGRNAISWQQKLELDAQYTEQLSFWLDVKILFKTVLKVIKSEGVSQNGHVTMEKFSGNG